MICSATRYLMVAWIVGVVAASFTGSEALAWTAAAGAVSLTYAVTRWGPQRFQATSCAIPNSTADTGRMRRRSAPKDEEPEPTGSVAVSSVEAASSGR